MRKIDRGVGVPLDLFLLCGCWICFESASPKTM